MNCPKSSSMSSPLAIKPMEIKSSAFSQNVTDDAAYIGHQLATPRVNSADNTNPATATEFLDGASNNGSKSDNLLGNVRSLVFDVKDVRCDLGPPDENQSPSSSVAGTKRKVTDDEFPILEVKKLHAFRKEQMPVYWNISNLKPCKVTRHLRCLLLAVESRPSFEQILPQYYQLRDHFVYSFGFLQIHSTGPEYQIKLQELYKSVFDKLHRLLAFADRLEDSDGENSEANDENQSEPPDISKRPRHG